MKIPKKTAIIVGNGKSRENASLIQFSKLGTVFGCNALYRDYEKYPWYTIPDYLVCIDEKIYLEIKESEYPEDKVIYPPYEEQFEPREMHLNQPYSPRSNAGMVAMIEAIKRGYNHLICIGFDFLLHDTSLVTSNVYEGTNAYEAETKASLADSRNRLNFLAYVLDSYKSVNFEFVYPKSAVVYQPVCDNFILSTYEHLLIK